MDKDTTVSKMEIVTQTVSYRENLGNLMASTRKSND